MDRYITKKKRQEAATQKLKKHNEYVKEMMAQKTQERLTIRQKIDERRRKAKLLPPQGIPLTPIIPPETMAPKKSIPSTNIELYQAEIGAPRIHYLFQHAPLSEDKIREYSMFFNKKCKLNINGLSLWDFTNFIKNKTIALVANSSELLNHLHGNDIDTNDIIIRFNSYTLLPEFTGSQTTIHSYIHLQDANINNYVPLRLVLAPNISKWQIAVQRLNKNKQGGIIKYFSEFDFLKSFVSKAPLTSGLRTLLMLISIGGYAKITLYGFDFYENQEKSILRDITSETGISQVHDYPMERKLMNELCDAYDKINNLYIFNGNRSL